MAKKVKAAEEKVYTITIRKEWIKQSRVRRANRSVNFIREFLEKHTKAETVMISTGLNEMIWLSGAKKPPGKVKVSVSLEDGVAFARLPGEAAAAKESKPAEAKASGAETPKEPKPEAGQAREKSAKPAAAKGDLSVEEKKILEEATEKAKEDKK